MEAKGVAFTHTVLFDCILYPNEKQVDVVGYSLKPKGIPHCLPNVKKTGEQCNDFAIASPV